MTIREVVANIREAVKEHSADSVFSNRYLYRTALNVAKVLIKRDTDQYRSIFNQEEGWSTHCVEMLEVSPVDCCIPIPIDCKISRSEFKLPKFYETGFGILYKDISTPDYSIHFSLTNPEYYLIKSKVKYNKQKYAFIDNGYLFAPNADYPYLKIVAFFEEKTKDCKQSTDFQCSILDNQFPCPGYLRQAVIDECMNRLFPAKQIPFDHITDKNSNN